MLLSFLVACQPSAPPPVNTWLPDTDVQGIERDRRAVMLVQDFSGSMLGVSSKGASPLVQARAGARLFLEALVDEPVDGDLLGIAGFAEFGVDDAGWDTLDPTDPTWAELVSVRDRQPYLQEKITGICAPIDGCGDGTPSPLASIGSCTNVGIGLQMAMEQFRAHTDDRRHARILVLTSGGAFDCGGTEARSPLLTAQFLAEEAFVELGIQIWTVFAATDPTAPGAAVAEAELGSLIRGGGRALVADDPADIPALYLEVAAALPFGP